MRGLRGKNSIVFAGSRGIGRATATRLGSEGGRVAVGFTHNAAAAEEVVGTIAQAGGEAFAFRADVSDREQVTAAFSETEAAFGAIDIAVNAGAVSVFGPHEEVRASDFERAAAVNAGGAFYFLKEAAKRVRDGGRVIQFSTGGTRMPVAGGGVYAGTKAAGEHMALALAKELGARRVTVNVISPGVTDTEGLVMPKEQVAMLIAQTPLGRLGQPEDVADVVVFLASEEARWVTGQNIQANGGIL